MRPGSAWAAALGLSLVAASVARADEPGQLFLGELPVVAAAPMAPTGPVTVELELHPSGSAKAASLVEWFPSPAVRDGRVAVNLGDDLGGATRPGPAHLQASFLVDTDVPGMAALRAEVVRAHGEHPSEAALVAFVDGWITTKDMRRLFDPASTVAARREGDCTEHAVLLAAVARLFGRPSRVVLGIALFPVAGRLRGFGHAWAELHVEGRWRTYDAVTLPPGSRHLPLAVMVDEGPAYALAMWSRLSPIDVRKVTVTGTAGIARP